MSVLPDIIRLPLFISPASDAVPSFFSRNFMRVRAEKSTFICICQNFFVPLQSQRFETMNDYRFINIDQEPTEEQLAQLMCEVAAEAKERFDKARSAYFAHIRQMAQAL
jgi:hypothetical protein